MHRHVAFGIGPMIVALIGSPALGDVLVTLEAKDAASNPISGVVPRGSQLSVDILLSVDEEDNPLPDVRGIQFDFGATSPAIELTGFTWHISTSGYSLQIDGLPRPGAATTRFSSSPELLVLDDTPVLVGTVEVTVNDTGVIDTGFSADNAESSAASFTVDFENPMDYSAAMGNVTGGALALSVPGPTEGDGDGDGVPDEDDAFPDDPAETVDTDGDGVGDVADPDDDDDGVEDEEDAFPLDPAEVADTDGDGVGDVADAFPEDPDEQLDTDGDGTGDNADADDDGDGVDDAADAFPLDPSETSDSDGDGIGDNAEGDQNSGTRVGAGLCGLGMIGSSLCILLGLAGARVSWRIGRRRKH